MPDQIKPETESNSANAEAAIRRAAWYSLIVNAGLVAAKFLLSRLSGSLALEADAIHSLLDVIASIAILAGIWLSSRKSKEFPYGLYKVENLVSVVIAGLIFLTAWEIATEAFSGTSGTASFSGWVLLAVALLVSVPYLLGSYEVRVGRVCHSPSLIADGRQHRVDVLSTSVVFFALLAQYFGLPIDGPAAVIVAGFIVWSGWGILKDSMRTLLDASIDHETREIIRSAIIADPAVTGIRELAARNSGRYIFVEAVVWMKQTDLARATLASERIEARIRGMVPNVERVVIHPEPRERSYLRFVVPLDDLDGTVSPHFGEAPYFALLDFGTKDGAFQRKEIVTNPAQDLEKQKGLRAAEMLVLHKPDVVYSKQSLLGKSPEYVFEAASTVVKTTEAASLQELRREIEEEMGKRPGN